MTGLMLRFSFFFSSRRRHTRFDCDWSSDVCSSDLVEPPRLGKAFPVRVPQVDADGNEVAGVRSEEHTSELQSQSISYAVFCLKKKKKKTNKISDKINTVTTRIITM